MSDLKSINNVNPAYPIKPVQPSSKDRESDRRETYHKDADEAEDKDDDPNLIDEYV